MLYVKEIKQIPRPTHFDGGLWNLRGLKPLTLFIGKNGSGKTTLLDAVRDKIRDQIIPPNTAGDISLSETVATEVKIVVDKIAAERGGTYQFNGNLSNALLNPTDLYNRRRGSVAREFREEVASRYDRLMAHISHNDTDGHERPAQKVQKIVSLLNELVPKKYEVVKSENNFKILHRLTRTEVAFNNLSSGEVEMFTLGLECLVVANWRQSDTPRLIRVLLIDEPDVHIHPDLQSKFLKFLTDLSHEYDLQILICTHSTVFVASLAEGDDASIVWMDGYDSEIIARSKRKSINDLSVLLGGNIIMQVLLNHKIVLVEGDSDLEAFTQMLKSSEGAFLGYIHKCAGKDEMRKIETGIGKVVGALCDEDDTRVVVSIRDSDGADGEIDNRPFVERYRLQCHELENCILSDEFLTQYGKTIESIGFAGDRKADDIKAQLPTLLVQITGTPDTKWAREIGKVLGNVLKNTTSKDELDTFPENSIVRFIGVELMKDLKG